MDIFNRPPAIAEDTIQYTLHPGPAFEDKSAIITLTTLIDSYVSALLPNHIWHRDAFESKVVRSPYGKGGWIIEGRMRVGDCVDDEWCVVWLLREITRRWDVVVNVFDSDGDFLLIEAAEHLPSWVTPTNSENRVWIYTGRLYLVPLQYISPAPPKQERRMLGGAGSEDDEGDQENGSEYISVTDAIAAVRNARENALATPDVEHAAFRRIEAYPEAARQHVHRTKAFVPSDIALALSSDPSLIQKAVEAFYTRDALQLRAANRMARFPPDSSVLVTVTLTRTAYAQLIGQRFHPPKVFRQWNTKEGSSEWRWRENGMKIACGFEMVYQETKSRCDATADGLTRSGASIEARKEALRRDPEYVQYIKGLQSAGFFKTEIEGSSFWRDQEARAITQFIRARETDNANRRSFALLVNSAILQAQMQKGNEDISHLDREEDSEEWLSVDESMMDNLLGRSQKTPRAQREASMIVDEGPLRELEESQAAEQANQLRTLASKVEGFVEGQGDFEGATFEDELLSDEADMSELSDSDDEHSSDSQANDIAERRAAMDRLVPALEPSEYGKMPPLFHSNSQQVKKSSMGTEGSPVESLPKQDASSQPKPMRPLIFPRDQFDGVEDSDDESEGEKDGLDEDDESEEDRPQVVGELEVDMQEEEEEFLQFSREALGISSEMWNDIIKERKSKEVFIPPSVLREDFAQNSQMPSTSTVRNAAGSRSLTDSGLHSTRNPNLDSFEAVMLAMNAELSRAKRDTQGGISKATSKVSLASNIKDKGKQKDDEGDIASAAMDTELQAALQDSSDDDEDQKTPTDYILIKNFLESFKSQQGLPGPVGNLVGRLGWQLPRDES